MSAAKSPPQSARSGPLLTQKEAAAYLKVTEAAMQKWRVRGTGPVFSAALGRQPRFYQSDLDAWVSSHMAANAVEARLIRKGRNLG